MGWQDRDYARLNDDEFDELYRVRRGRTSDRRIGWTLVAMAAIAVLTFGYHERGVVNGGPVGFQTPAVMYGTTITTGPLAGSVCTEFEFVSTARRWRCDVYQLNEAHVPVYPATHYTGPCAHLKVEGRDWICLSAVPAAGRTT